MTSMAERLLSVATPDEPIITRAPAPPGWTVGYEWDGISGEIRTEGLAERPKTWDEFIRDAGLDPEEVTVVEPVGVRGWDANAGRNADGEVEIKRLRWYSLRIIRRNAAAANIDELVAAIGGDRFKKPRPAPVGYHTFHLDAGDLQLGKIDGDGVEGTVDRYIAGVDEAVRNLKALRKRKPIGHVHLGWLGDCIEGYVSQGGANAWRTGLPLTDQTRLLRRLMLYTIQSFAPLAEKVTALSVPGNHDEAVRFGGKQVTTFSDSHAVDALYAVGDALQLNTRSYGHVQIIPLKVDDVSITVDLSGTTVVHSHGHMWGRGKHFDWWKGQTFGNHPPAAATIMVTAHEHHAMMDTLGRRTVLRVPALELESTWWKLKTGETGMPGQLVFTTRAGAWSDLAIV